MKNRIIWSFNVIIFIIFLISCDKIYDIRYTVKLQGPIKKECVLSSLNSVKNIDNIKYERINDSNTNTFYDQYTYNSDYFGGFVEIKQTENNIWFLIIRKSWFNKRISSETANELRKQMNEIYKSLQEYCPGLPSSDAIDERSLGIPKKKNK